MWLQFKRVFKAGLLNFWRTPVVASVSVITMTIMMLVLGGIFLSRAYLLSSLEAVQNKVDISVSLKTGIAETEALNLKKSLEQLPEVKAVVYSSREAELADFKQQHADNDLVLRSLDEVGNPFGARLNITAVDPARYESIVKFLEGDSALAAGGKSVVDQVSFKKDVAERLLSLIATAKKVGWALVIILVFISLVVNFNTIALAIYSSREEIALMKLVGAGNNYVRMPFIIEGIMAGTLASVLAILMLYPVVLWVRNATVALYGGVNLVTYFLTHAVLIFLAMFFCGVVVGTASSLLAIRRYLKV
jgi:cell division transport system permease protein